MKRYVRNSVLAFAGCILFLWIAREIVVNHILPYSPIRPHRVSREELSRYFPAGVDPGALGLKYSPLNVNVAESIELKGWFIYSSTDSAIGTVILLHGIASCKESMLLVADSLARNGFNSILYDSRAHGESGGINCTFGYYEKRDVSAYVDAALREFPGAAPLGIYGSSLGAAVAIQAMAIDHRIRCGVVLAPFATLREVIYDYWKSISFLPIHSIPDDALKISERVAGFEVDSVKPEESAKQVGNPVLVFHGNEDKKISIHYGERVFRNLQSPAKQWYAVVGASHENLDQIASHSFQHTIIEFLRANLAK